MLRLALPGVRGSGKLVDSTFLNGQRRDGCPSLGFEESRKNWPA